MGVGNHYIFLSKIRKRVFKFELRFSPQNFTKWTDQPEMPNKEQEDILGKLDNISAASRTE